MKRFDDASGLLNLATRSDRSMCNARREWWLVTAALALSQLMVGMWWITRSASAAGPLRLALVAAYLPPSAWLMADGWRRYRGR